MPEDDTTTFERGKGAVLKHGNKVYNTLSAGAIIWMFATFVAKDDYRDHCRKCELFVTQTEFERERQSNKESHSALWRRGEDLDGKLDRLHANLSKTNALTAAVP